LRTSDSSKYWLSRTPKDFGDAPRFVDVVSKTSARCDLMGISLRAWSQKPSGACLSRLAKSGCKARVLIMDEEHPSLMHLINDNIPGQDITSIRRMKPEPAVSPPEACIKGHVPDKAHDDHSQQDRAGDCKVSPSICWFQALENWPNLQADEDESQDVQREHDCLSHGIARYACPCGSSFRRSPCHRDGIAHHRQHA
jgi:hypothetical protein